MSANWKDSCEYSDFRIQEWGAQGNPGSARGGKRTLGTLCNCVQYFENVHKHLSVKRTHTSYGMLKWACDMSFPPPQIKNSGLSDVSSIPGIWCNAAELPKWGIAAESQLLRKAAHPWWEGISGTHAASTSLCDPHKPCFLIGFSYHIWKKKIVWISWSQWSLPVLTM